MNRTTEQKKKYNARQITQRQNIPDYHAERGRWYQLKSRYGISREDYERILKSQEGHCAVCPVTSNLALDHDHNTTLNRGILCKQHNIMLGYIEREPYIVDTLFDYLVFHNAQR